jgi:hypothetical protein
MRVEAALKVCAISVGPHVPERLYLGYKRVQGGFEGTSVGKESVKEESDVLNKRRKIPPASPVAAYLQDFLAVGTSCCYRPQAVEYRPRIYRPEMSRFAGLSPPR